MMFVQFHALNSATKAESLIVHHSESREYKSKVLLTLASTINIFHILKQFNFNLNKRKNFCTIQA